MCCADGPSLSRASARWPQFLLDFGRCAVKDSARAATWYRSCTKGPESSWASLSFGLIFMRRSRDPFLKTSAWIMMSRVSHLWYYRNYLEEQRMKLPACVQTSLYIWQRSAGQNVVRKTLKIVDFSNCDRPKVQPQTRQSGFELCLGGQYDRPPNSDLN